MLRRVRSTSFGRTDHVDWRAGHREQCKSLSAGAEARTAPPPKLHVEEFTAWLQPFFRTHFTRAVVIALQDRIQQTGSPAVIEEFVLTALASAVVDAVTGEPRFRFDSFTLLPPADKGAVFMTPLKIRNAIAEQRKANPELPPASFIFTVFSLEADGAHSKTRTAALPILHSSVDAILRDPPAQSSWMLELLRQSGVSSAEWKTRIAPPGTFGNSKPYLGVGTRDGAVFAGASGGLP